MRRSTHHTFSFIPAALMICSVLVASAITPLAHAQSTSDIESITLSPVSKNYEVKPGEVLKDSLTVLNDGQTSYEFTVYATPYSVVNEVYDPSFTDNLPRADAYTWVQFEKTTYYAEPRQTIEIPYTVQVKADAMPGGHYGAIFVETKPGENEQLARKKRVGAILYATVEGDVIRKGQVESTAIPWFQTRPPLRATADISNDGNTDFQTKATYEVKDIFGRVLYAAEQSFAVLPETTRRIELQWTNASWFGLYHISMTASALESEQVASSYVMVMPMWLIILVILVVAGGVAHVYLGRKRRRKK